MLCFNPVLVLQNIKQKKYFLQLSPKMFNAKCAKLFSLNLVLILSRRPMISQIRTSQELKFQLFGQYQSQLHPVRPEVPEASSLLIFTTRFHCFNQPLTLHYTATPPSVGYQPQYGWNEWRSIRHSGAKEEFNARCHFRWRTTSGYYTPGIHARNFSGPGFSIFRCTLVEHSIPFCGSTAPFILQELQFQFFLILSC